MLLEIGIDGDIYVLVNIYKNNIESDQKHTLLELNILLNKFLTSQEQKTILESDFNLFFDSLAEKEGGNSILRIESLAEIIEILDNYDGCDILRIGIPKLNVLLLNAEMFGLFFYTNILQESVKLTDILAPFSSDQIPILVSLTKSVILSRGRGCKIHRGNENHITAFLKNFDEENIRNE